MAFGFKEGIPSFFVAGEKKRYYNEKNGELVFMTYFGSKSPNYTKSSAKINSVDTSGIFSFYNNTASYQLIEDYSEESERLALYDQRKELIQNFLDACDQTLEELESNKKDLEAVLERNEKGDQVGLPRNFMGLGNRYYTPEEYAERYAAEAKRGGSSCFFIWNTRNVYRNIECLFARNDWYGL